MHAVILRVTIHDDEQADRTLREETVPAVSGLPGFVHGYWMGPYEGGGISTTLWESEEAARAAAERARSASPAGVTIDRVDVVEVAAHA
ncbi:MAG TPA: hypothetical protein VFT42_02500 [Solirubrobacteraceae bacterium]|nr:hypothetical protein [Solirubrobacteraceae bacterium]